MAQFEIADLFGVLSCDIRKQIRSIYKSKELDDVETQKYIRQSNGIGYGTYGIEMITAIACIQGMRQKKYFVRAVCNK